MDSRVSLSTVLAFINCRMVSRVDVSICTRQRVTSPPGVRLAKNGSKKLVVQSEKE